jgi:WD40 repeat protein
VSGGQDGSVIVTSLVGESPETLLEHGGEREGAVYVAVFSPDGKSLVTGSENGTLRLWDLDGIVHDARVLAGHRGAITAAAYSSDSQVIASAGVDGTIRLWSSEGDTLAVLRGHQGTAESVYFTLGGRQVVSGGGDGTIRVWDVGRARLLVTLPKHDNRITSVDVSSDGHWLVTASEEEEVVRVTSCAVCGPIGSVLDIARERAIRPLTAEEERRFAS